MNWRKTRALEISPRETVESHLTQIDKLNPGINAFIKVCHEEARRPLTGPHNFTGFPGQVVSTGFSPVENMPVAMRIVGLAGAEARMFLIAHAYGQATPEVRNRLPEILK